MKKKDTKTLVLLDAHAILHRAYHALPDFAAPNGEPTGALYGVVSMLIKIVEDLKPDYLVACYDLPEPTHRHQAFEGYKATRSKTDDTLITQILRSRDIMSALNIPIYEKSGFEADDILGTIAAKTKEEEGLEVIIASGDMDTLQLVDRKRVQVFTQRKGSEVVMYDEAAVKKRFGFGPKLTIDYKGLRGDASDNIPGVPGVGEGSALKLISAYGQIEKLYKALKKDGVEAVAKKAGVQKRFAQAVADHEEEALFSKMLATIHTDVPVDWEIPKESWRDGIDMEATLKLFSDLGFRTLTTRFKQLLEIDEVESAAYSAGVSADEAAEAASMLWLLESDRTNPTVDDVIDYGRSRFDSTNWKEIVKCLEEELKKQNLWQLYEEVEKPLLPVIDKMNKTGITLDINYLNKLSKKFHKELDTLVERIYKLAGTEFNINSPKQMGEVLYDKLELKPKRQKKTAGGARSTRESELVQMIDDHPIIKDILRYRELSKLVSTYIDNLPEQVGKDGRLHSTFLPQGTVTGRIGSKDPNLQNIPIRSSEGREVRKAFVSEKGYKLVAIDYSQIELRIAAILSGDPGMLEIFKSGEDVHRSVAARVFNVDEDKVTSDMRRQAKVINFGILYGMGVNALRTNLGEGTTREEAQEFLNAYFNTFTRLAEYLEETKQFAREHGYTKTMFGRRRHFPGISSSASFIRASAERMAINAPIQGTEGDILRIAMVDIDNYIAKAKLSDKVRVLLQVHDELIFEINEDRVDDVVPELANLMREVFGDKDTRGVPIEVETKVGENWEEMTELKVKS